MNIIGRTVRLRAVEEEDLPALHDWANDPEIGRLLAGWHFPHSRDSQRRWFDGLKDDARNQRFAVDTSDLGLIGTANLVDIDWRDGHAFHGMLLGSKELRGRGLGVDTVMTVMRYAFDELRLQRLDGAMIEYNLASIKLYCGKCGWVEEGRLRNWYHRDGRYWDRVVVGVTRDDYHRLVEETGYWEASVPAPAGAAR
ncbi:GNAT family N-acetyltransferase [Pseudonocardia sp. C8]|uniref:GNAT family N-acetyltransferase n=1 Tax=Pseudonocardia sp. C8 TaxID=2762759 RepID=UPI001642E1A7|nr:GNAT family protein [Pseudonocardia sp. C8]MBC3193497.1 GNAT family N-acetyltransferase [Pseudonocardia sp. C8]